MPIQTAKIGRYSEIIDREDITPIDGRRKDGWCSFVGKVLTVLVTVYLISLGVHRYNRLLRVSSVEVGNY